MWLYVTLRRMEGPNDRIKVYKIVTCFGIFQCIIFITPLPIVSRTFLYIEHWKNIYRVVTPTGHLHVTKVQTLSLVVLLKYSSTIFNHRKTECFSLCKLQNASALWHNKSRMIFKLQGTCFINIFLIKKENYRSEWPLVSHLLEAQSAITEVCDPLSGLECIK